MHFVGNQLQNCLFILFYVRLMWDLQQQTVRWITELSNHYQNTDGRSRRRLVFRDGDSVTPQGSLFSLLQLQSVTLTGDCAGV